MRPLIGITSSLALESDGKELAQLYLAYSRAVADAGGVPVVIPAHLSTETGEELAARFDGILFSGGGDIEPRRYNGDAAALLIEVSPERDALELDLLHRMVDQGKPFLGICRGCQLVNVGLGGTLYEDLGTSSATSIRHNAPWNDTRVLAHDVNLEVDTRIHRLMGRATFGVNSHHHQGVRHVAAPLRVAARAPDGLVEAVELEAHPFGVAVQWHPEWLTHEAWTRDLFRGFISAAAPNR